MDFLENYELNDEVLDEMNLDEIFPELLETIKSLPAPAQATLAEMMDKYPIEEALAKFFDVDDDIDDTLADTFCYSNPDPYFKIEPLSDDRPSHNIRFDEDGHIHVKNLSAWWIPDLAIEREIGGTVYTVTGSFDGEECMLRKLERISAKKFTNTEEDVNDTDE